MTIERRRTRAGFTLAEAMLALVLLGIAAGSVLLPYSAGAAAQAEGRRRTLATILGNDLVERVVVTPFDEVVATWDGYAELEGQIKDAGGVVFADPRYAKFARGVSCVYVYVPQQGGIAAPNFVRVTVQVEYAGQQTVVVSRLISA